MIRNKSCRKEHARIYLGIVFILMLPQASAISIDPSLFYFGANAGYSEGNNSNKKSGSSVKKFTLGYSPNRYLSVDISRFTEDHSWSESTLFSEEGFEERTKEDISTTGVSVSALLNYSFSSRMTAFVRLGASSWDLSRDNSYSTIELTSGFSSDSFSNSASHSGTGFVYGSGVRYLFGSARNYELRFEWERAAYKASKASETLTDSHGLSNVSDFSVTTNSFSAGLMFHFGKNSNKKHESPLQLPSAMLSDASVDDDNYLIFSLDLTHSSSTDIPFELNLISGDDQNELNNKEINIEISFDDAKSWNGVGLDNINSMDAEDSLESILSDSGFSFIFPAGKAASLIRVKANNKRIVAKRMIKLKLKPQSNLIANNSLQATGIILPAEIEKSEVASFEGKNSASVLRSIPDVIPAPIPASTVKNSDPKDFAMLSVTDDKQTAEKPVIELTVASPGKIAKKRILPMVRPFEEKNATANELAVSNLIWNDVKAYNAFDDSSPILLPGIDLISTWVGANDSTSISDSNSGSMYEEAEIAARKGNAGVAIWGNSMEYAGKIYIESHLSLVDEPVNFNVKFNSLNALSLSLTIPRTRFAFALKELSDKDINQRKLITLQDASVFAQQQASSKVISTVNAGKIVKSNNTKNEWFKVSNVNGQHGWIHASKVAILPYEVYVQTPDISVFNEAGGGESTTVNKPVDSLKVLDVKIINSITWFQVKLPSHLILSDSSTSGSLVTGWLNSVNLKSRPVLPMTEFLLGMQYFQRQDFDNAIQAINRFIKTADKENENNVALSTAYQMLSLCYMQQLSWIDARESIDKAILLTKYDPSLYSFKAIALLGEKSGSKQVIQIKKIMKNLEYALYLEPEDILARDVVSALNQVLKKKTNTSPNIVFNESDKEDFNKLIQHFKFSGID